MKHISDESSLYFSSFIESLLGQEEIDIYWKDEAMSAILLSDDPLPFFNSQEELLIVNDGKILRRLIFILCLSCKIPDKQLIDSFKLSKKTSQLLCSSFLIPFGNGWSALLNFINSRINSFNDTFIDDFVKLLKEWLLLIRIDQSLPIESKAAGEIAFNLLSKYKDNITDNQQLEAIVKVLIYLYPVVKSKINKLIMQDIFYDEKRNKRDRSDWANIFVEQVLATLPNVQFLCKYHPLLVIRIAWQYWKIEENREKYISMDIDADFGFQEFIGRNIECFPSSGLQGPFDSLLKYHPKIGINFILELCNYSAIAYSQSKYGKSECKYVFLEMNDGSKIKQICCERLWMAYRGTSVSPYILQSALMALENYLINKIDEGKDISAYIENILSKSNSVLTTGLVAGLAIGYWQQLGKVILPILRIREFYNLDYLRLIKEQSSDPNRFYYTHHNDVMKELFYNERMRSNNRIWRKIPLENIIPNLLLSDMKEEVSDIIDSFYKELSPISQQNNGDKHWRLILNRMDIRKYHADVSDKTKCILKMPDPEADLYDYVNKSLQHENFITPFYKLNAWGKRVFDGENVIDSYTHYTEAISDAKKIQKLSQESPSNEYVMLFKGGVTLTAVICVRDHWSELTYEDKLWSLSVVEEAISLESQNNHVLEDAIMFNESYAAAFILPQLCGYFINSDNEKKLKNLIAIALTHESESIRQAVCQGINKYLWNYVPDFAQSCLWGSIEYSFLREKLLNTNYIPQRIKETNLYQEKILILREQIFKQNVELDINTLRNFKFSKYIFNETSISLSMIPDNYISSDYIELLIFYLSKIIVIFKENKGGRDVEISYNAIRFYLYKIAYIVLVQPNEKTKNLFYKILKEINTSPYLAALFLKQLSYITEFNKTYIEYWSYWEKIANASITIISESSINSYDYKEKCIDELIESLLFSWVDWDPKNKGMEWIEHGIVDIENFAAKTGQNPDVVEAILKYYDYFTKKFRETGLFLVSNILKQHSVEVVKLGINSRYYLERSVQHLINSQEFIQMRVNRRFIRELLFVLDSLIEMGSSQSYFLRERVLVNS